MVVQIQPLAAAPPLIDELYDSAKPSPGVIVQAVCKTVGPASGITAASSVKAISRSASSEDPDLLKTLQSFRDQLLRRSKSTGGKKVELFQGIKVWFAELNRLY